MTVDSGAIGDKVEIMLDRYVDEASRGKELAVPTDPLRIKGFVEIELRRGLRILQREVVANLVTQVGDQFYGDRAAQIKGTAKTITAITNATTAVVTTSTNHGYTVGDAVTIAGVTPAGYNGSWAVVSVPSATTFGIYVGTALGAGSAFGTSTGLSLGMVTGMKLGTGTTAAAKTGAGAAIVTYKTGSQIALVGGFPTSSLNGASRRIQYQALWAAGTATDAALTEATLTNETPLANGAGTAADTISRVVFSAVNKGALDTLTITWSHDLLGA
jgi:hypothetical protein